GRLVYLPAGTHGWTGCPPPSGSSLPPSRGKARSRRSLPRASSRSKHSAKASVEEGHVPHGLGLPLGVHHDLVPAVERDRGVVGVSDPATDVDAGVAPHGAPAPALRLRAAGQDAPVLRLSDAVGVAGADVDR